MTRDQVIDLLSLRAALWPHSPVGPDYDVAVRVWHQMLGYFEAEDVVLAMQDSLAAGEAHAPLVGQLVKTLAERAVCAPEWDEAWAEVRYMIRSVGRTRTPLAREFSHPVVAEFARPAWRELCDGPAPGTSGYGTFHAQQREAYRALSARGTRDLALAAVGAPRRRSSVGRLAPALGLPMPSEMRKVGGAGAA